MERSGTNDFKDDRHPEKYLRVFYCGYHRRGKIVFYKKVSDRWYLPFCHRENLNLIYVELLFTGNIPRGVFCEQSSQKTRELSLRSKRYFLCLSQEGSSFCALRSVLLVTE